MASIMTLDQIRDAAEQKYGAKVIDLGDDKTVELKNPLRLSKDNRDAITELSPEDFDDVVDYFRAAFEAVAGKKGAAELCKALGDDPALYATVFESYMQEAQVGEASPSQA